VKTTIAITAALAALLALSGCADDTTDPSVSQRSAETSETPEPTTTESPEPIAEAPTGAGEICDIASMYTAECDTQFPETGFLNAMHRAEVSLPGLWDAYTDEDLLAFGQEACTQLDNGVARVDLATIANSDSAATTGSPNSILAGSAPILCPQG
jgi:hypothetical protein